MLKNFFLSQKKLLNVILRAKLNYMKMFLSNEMKLFFAMQTTAFMSWAFLQKSPFRSLNARNHFLELLRTPILLCLVQTKQIMRMWGHRCSKASFLSQKKLLNAILRAKLNYMKKYSF